MINPKELVGRLMVLPLRLRLKNHGFSLISNNCSGAIIYHDLGERFNSPTINLAFPREDFLVFVENLKECLSAPIEQVPEYIENGKPATYPVGKMTLKDGRTVRLLFMHYKSFEDAKNKWVERCKRVNWDNLYIFMEAGVNTEEETVRRFSALPFAHKVIITGKDFSQYPCAYHIDIYGKGYQWGMLIQRDPRTLKTRRYINRFDYVKWLNK